MAKKTKKRVTEELFNTIHTLRSQTSLNNNQISEVTKFSKSTVSRVLTSPTFDDYQEQLSVIREQSRKRTEENKSTLQLEDNAPVVLPDDSPVGLTDPRLETTEELQELIHLAQENNRLLARMVELWEEKPRSKNSLWETFKA